MDRRAHIEKIDQKMQTLGWSFYAPILHYKKAWKNQAAIYEKNGEYVVSGLDFTGENELFEPIEKNEAKRRGEESLEEIKNCIFGS